MQRVFSLWQQILNPHVWKAKEFRISKPWKVLYYNCWLKEVKKDSPCAMFCPLLEPAEYWCISGNKHVSCTALAPSKALYYNRHLSEVKRNHPVQYCVMYWSQQNTGPFVAVHVCCVLHFTVDKFPTLQTYHW
jgi:hypothetical protein